MSDDLADRVVLACHEKGKIVAEEQRIAAEAEAARKAEDAAATDHLLGGGSIGGMGVGGGAVETDAGAESAADSILGGGN